jgi:hypothetical protein
MQGQGLFQSFFQAACCTGVDLLQFTLDLLQATFGLRVAQQIIGVRQLAVPVGLLLVGEVLTDVPPFVEDAPLHPQLFPTMLLDRGSQTAPSIEDGDEPLVQV